MSTCVGISAGSEVVCAALAATNDDGTTEFDYRVLSTDMAHCDLGDLVASSVELMTRPPRDFGHRAHHAVETADPPTRSVSQPDTIAVAYRDRDQEVSIRLAMGRQHTVRLIPETDAVMAYLRHTDLLGEGGNIAIVDLGATGTTVTVVTVANDPADYALMRRERTTSFSGDALDDLVYQYLLDCHLRRRGVPGRPNRSLLLNRSRAAKEHLSVAPAVTLDHIPDSGVPLRLTRSDFAELSAESLQELAAFAAGVFRRADCYPDLVIAIGGSANLEEVVVAALGRLLGIPAVTVAEPEAVVAKGAALLADQPLATAGHDPETTVGTLTLVGALALAAVVVVGLVVGYSTRPVPKHDVTTVGTSTTTQLGSPAPGPGNSLGHIPAGPPLRPDPNLPAIPMPAPVGSP